MSRRATSLVVFTGFLTLAAGVLIAQGPAPNPFVARFQALKLDVVTGDVPAYYSKGIARDIVASLAQRLDGCRSLYPEAGRPAFVLAVLHRQHWPQGVPPYGMPLSAGVPGAEPPYIIVVPETVRDADPWLAGARDYLAKVVGEANQDRYFRLLALHELGHIILSGVLGPRDATPQTTAQVRQRFPFWYGEFVANYFAGNCYSLKADDAALFRRFDAVAPIPGQKYTMLDDLDRVMADGRDTGRPYLMTEEGGLNLAAYEALTGEMANRLRDAGFTAPRMIPLLRQQWARPGRQSTDDLLKDFTGAAPGLYEWLVQAGAVQPPGKH